MTTTEPDSVPSWVAWLEYAETIVRKHNSAQIPRTWSGQWERIWRLAVVAAKYDEEFWRRAASVFSLTSAHPEELRMSPEFWLGRVCIGDGEGVKVTVLSRVLRYGANEDRTKLWYVVCRQAWTEWLPQKEIVGRWCAPREKGAWLAQGARILGPTLIATVPEEVWLEHDDENRNVAYWYIVTDGRWLSVFVDSLFVQTLEQIQREQSLRRDDLYWLDRVTEQDPELRNRLLAGSKS